MINSNKKTLFVVKETKSDERSFLISQDIEVSDTVELLSQVKLNKSVSDFQLEVVTDPFEYKGNDQVIPLQPEQIFFMDYTEQSDLKNASILEVGVGSGVLSIFCLLQGAKDCVALDINPRAKMYTGFNAMVNGVEDKIELRDGVIGDIFLPVKGRAFNFILSNPPFEPTPPSMDYYLNSAAGIYGLNFVADLIEGVDAQLADNGMFEMVTMAPGNIDEPFMLTDLINTHLAGKACEVILDLSPITYDDFVDRFTNIFDEDKSEIDMMKQIARDNGVTHLHMLVMKYKKGVAGELKYTRTEKTYETWDSPLGEHVSITEVMS